MASRIQYDSATMPEASELRRFYDRQHHATTNSEEKLQAMMSRTFCLVTARKEGEIIGLARGVTDGLRGQLVECKLDPAFQGPACVTHTDGRIEHDSAGIAREMALRVIDAFRRAGVERVDVMAYGTEVDFCEELGFKRTPGVVALQLNPADAPTPSSPE
ncbi:MAG TPA: hypothetical protein VM243_20835 [Phycisphaerae bacterium]|nr:hypothetical protein [Phycisphaerae bacterium]